MAEKQVLNLENFSSPKAVFEQLMAALNRHDIEAMVGLFAEDFSSEQPLHPQRAFTGPTGVRQNWTMFFKLVPDMQARLLNEVEDGEVVWAELHFYGTQADGKKYSAWGVNILGIKNGQIKWGRIYTEPVSD